MNDYIVYDGTEQNLENILIWWATREPWEHSDDCKGGAMHCCQGKNRPDARQAISSTSHIPFHEERGLVPIEFHDYETGVTKVLAPGDKIVYFGNYEFAVEYA
jgi:hypothetical protein